MKTAAKSLTLVLAFIFVSLASFGTAVEPIANVKVITTRYQNLFVFTVPRKFKGAIIEVYYSNGDLVDSMPMRKRKMIINFCDTKPGTYIIKVVKKNEVKEFEFIRK